MSEVKIDMKLAQKPDPTIIDPGLPAHYIFYATGVVVQDDDGQFRFKEDEWTTNVVSASFTLYTVTIFCIFLVELFFCICL